MKKGARKAAALALLLAACRGAPQQAPPDLDALIEARRFRAALAEVDARLAGAPGEAALLDRKLAVLRQLGREREALDVALKLRRAAPAEARFAYEAGELAARLGDSKLAREEFAAARALAADDWRAAVGEAALLLSQRPPELHAAEALLSPWLEGPSARAEARYHRGLLLEARGDAVGARAAFESALKLDPAQLPSLCGAARLAQAAGDRDRALDLLRRAKAAAAPDDTTLQRELDRRIAALAPPAAR
jgi:Flp pilus assembly protein TadD